MLADDGVVGVYAQLQRKDKEPSHSEHCVTRVKRLQLNCVGLISLSQKSLNPVSILNKSAADKAEGHGTTMNG